MRRAIKLEFGPSLFKSPREALLKLQQNGSIEEYYAEFVALTNHTNIEPPDAFKDCFMIGLCINIKCEVKVQCPSSLIRAMSLARLYEDKFSPTFKPSNDTNTNEYQPHNPIPIQQQRS